jgi:hypothetical protein
MKSDRVLDIVLGLFFIGLISGCAKIHEIVSPYPPDEKLIKLLTDNKESFETLVKLFEEDADLLSVDAEGADRVWRLGGREPGNLSEGRRRKYIDLMRALGVRSISRHIEPRPEDKSIFLQMWWVKNGPFLFSKSKYLVYKENPEHLVESLDPIYKSGRDASEFRRIDDDWSLYLDVW